MSKTEILSKEDDVGSEYNDRPFLGTNSRNNLTVIKEVYREFRSCLKGEARDKWLILVNYQLILTADDYVVNNTLGV